jgi:hypothetical protein
MVTECRVEQGRNDGISPVFCFMYTRRHTLLHKESSVVLIAYTRPAICGQPVFAARGLSRVKGSPVANKTEWNGVRFVGSSSQSHSLAVA